MTRRLSILGAILILLAGQLGAPAAALAAVPDAVNDSGVVVQKNASATTINVLANDTVDPADTITAVSAPVHGTAGIAVDSRSVTYKPTAGYTGLDTFTYTVSNDPDGDDTATVSLRVNAPPIAVDDPPLPSCSFGGAYGGSFPIPEDYGQFAFQGPCGALANDSDPDGTIVSWQVDVLPQHGTLQWLDTIPNVFGYTPSLNFSTADGDWISDSITYHLVDNNGASSNEATYRFWVAPVNDPPTFTSVPDVTVGVNSGPYDQSWLGNVSAGPPNEADQTVHFHITHVESHGVVNLFSVPPDFTPGGHLTFTPGPGEFGYALVTVYLQDDGGLNNYGISNLVHPPDDTSDPVTFQINVTAVGSPPVAVNDNAQVGEDAGATALPVLTNDSDPDDDPFSITGVTQGLKGLVAITGGGSGLTYTPNANANGLDLFSYTITDSNGLTDTANVAVSITPVDDAPVAVDDATTIVEDAGATAVNVLANDTDVDDPVLTVSATTNGTKGTVAISTGGAGVTYTPNPNANGADSFTYTVSDGHGGTDIGTVHVTITPVEDAPVAVSDAKTVTEDDGATAIDVRANDSDADGDTLTITDVSQGDKGSVAITGGGTGVSYTPHPDANGPDSFTYTIDDGNGGADVGTVNITITPVEDDPVATDDSKGIAENAGATEILVLANDVDVDGDTLTISAKTNGTKGVVAITGGGSNLTYTPNHNATGNDSFTYTIDDGHGGTSTATVNVTISSTEQPPDAVDDAKTLLEDAGSTAIDVLANDSDANLDPLTITTVTQGTIGAVAITAAGTGLTYAPAANANGTDTFTYTIDDGQGGTSTATVHITILPVNDAPIAAPDVVTVTEDQPAASAVDVLLNDGDVEGDELNVTAKTNGAKGTVTITGGGGALSYKPNANAFGSDSFTYTVSDAHGGSSIGTVSVTITPVNDPPNAVNDGVPTPYKVYLKGGAKAIPVLANDTSLPDAPETLHITGVTQGAHGAVAITGGGTGLTYAPTGTALGIDVFKYTISDGHGGTDTAQVQVTVARDMTAPTASIVSIQKSPIPGRTGLRVYVKWAISESGSGVASQVFQRRTGSGAWVTVSLASATTRTVSLALARGHTYTFRVRATDRAGNVGAFTSRQIRI